jgi:ATP-dependent DNA helicase RecQ
VGTIARVRTNPITPTTAPTKSVKPIEVSAAFAPAIQDVLRRYWGFDALRPLQAESINATIAGRDSLTVLATGGGKSLCYQVPPLVTNSLTLVVSPLISLMQDQVAGLRVAGIPAAAAHGNLSGKESNELRDLMRSGELRVLLVAPERLLTPGFMSWIVKQNIGAIAIDEAHCISQWGHDFRPEYRRLAELREALPGVPLGAYTATATPRVRQDIIEQLSLRDPVVVVGSADRPNLTYRILPRVDEVGQIVEALGRHPDRAAIVYCISRKNTESLAGALKAHKIDAAAYHAGLDAGVRSRISRDFRDERLRVVVATVAFGMGIDRADVRCVIHAAMPKSIEHYQQETGRAGRDGMPSECVMLYGAGDVFSWKRLLSDSENAAAQFELLDDIHRLVSSKACRHAALCAHFGEKYIPPAGSIGCGACDCCLGELHAVTDSHDTARKIISCVARCGQNVGAAHIAEVLRGSNAAKVIQKGHHQLSTHGLLSALEKSRIVAYIDQLVDQGHLIRTGGEYPVIHMGETAMAVLRNEIVVSLVEAKVHAEGGTRSVDGRDRPVLSKAEAELFERLRGLRKAIAAEKGLPPFTILHDATLEELCKVRPGSVQELASIRGVADRKVQEFGERLVEAIRAYAAELRLELSVAPTASRNARPSTNGGPSRRSAGSHAAGALFEEGRSVEEVMAEMGRARSTVFGYLAEYVQASRPASIARWVDDETYARVVQAIEDVQKSAPEAERGRLGPVFAKLDSAVGFEIIRLVMAHKNT